MYIVFDWDPAKAESNYRKHGVSFKEAATVFNDEHATQYFDDIHSVDERRFILLGLSSRLRILVISHCERDNGNTIRVISARKATRTEQVFYRNPRK